MSAGGPFERIEGILRDASGKILAVLLRDGHPLERSEDALADARRRALERWPVAGVPDQPEGWLLTVARHRALDAARREARLGPIELAGDRGAAPEPPAFDVVDDERLRLFLLCAHPAIEPAAQTPLMLQLVLGWTAEEIAQLFLATPAQASQWLVRAKRKIRDAGIPPALPPADRIEERLGAVLDAVYAAHTVAWELPADPGRRSLAAEAIRLASTIAELCPASAEAHGLRALLLLADARRGARRDASGAYVPLDEQDPAAWDAAMWAEGEAALRRAAELRRPGRYQIEAAIHSAHASRLARGEPGWREILALYDGLLRFAPTGGAQLGRLAALARVRGSEAALAELEALDPATLPGQPALALRANLLRASGRAAEADAAALLAAARTRDAAVATFLAP